jgi:hypothetical protein
LIATCVSWYRALPRSRAVPGMKFRASVGAGKLLGVEVEVDRENPDLK